MRIEGKFMTESLTLLQFQSPWQGRAGFARFTLDPTTGQVAESKSIKVKKMLKKGKGGIDGLILQPAWPTNRHLCVLPSENTLHLHQVVGGQIDFNVDPIDICDPSYKGTIKERLLYRSFAFETDSNRIVFSDLEGRLLGPERTAFDIFPTTDFSPFARLVRMIDDPQARQKLIEDLQNHRFEYPDWIEAGRSGVLNSVHAAAN